MNPNEQPGSHQEPLVSTPSPVQATAGTEQVSPIKRWLPRLIIGAVVINLIPSSFALFDQYELGETIRNYANIVFIVGFLIIILKVLSEKK